MNLGELKQAEREANDAYSIAERQLRAAVESAMQEAARKVDLAYKDQRAQVLALSRAASEAKRAREVEEVAQGANRTMKLQNGLVLHLGDRVTLVEERRYSWKRQKTTHGIVELATHDTVWPQNMRDYSRPNMGTLFIRCCDKDGKPGKSIIRRPYLQDWKLAAPVTK